MKSKIAELILRNEIVSYETGYFIYYHLISFYLLLLKV